MFSLENACDIYKPVSVKTMAQKILYSYCQWDESCAINANPMTPQGEIKQTAGGGVQHPAPHLLTFSVKKKKADSYFERDGINLLNGEQNPLQYFQSYGENMAIKILRSPLPWRRHAQCEEVLAIVDYSLLNKMVLISIPTLRSQLCLFPKNSWNLNLG